MREDAAIGIVFTTMFAFGLVLISVTPSNTDLNHILFGNVLGVSWSDVWQVAILAVVVAAVLLVKRRDFVLYAFDPGFAHAAATPHPADERHSQECGNDRAHCEGRTENVGEHHAG